MFTQVIATSVDAMILLLFFLTIAVILFGSLVYYAEKGEWNHELNGFARLDVTGQEYELTPFTSIPASFWWVVTTTTTVGYGDFYPTSVEGKLIGFVTMLMGILALALPVTIIGTNFAKIYRQMRDKALATDQKGMIDFFLEKSEVDEDEEEVGGGGGTQAATTDDADNEKGRTNTIKPTQIQPSSTEKCQDFSPPKSGGGGGGGGGNKKDDDVAAVLKQILLKITSLEEKVDAWRGHPETNPPPPPPGNPSP